MGEPALEHDDGGAAAAGAPAPPSGGGEETHVEGGPTTSAFDGDYRQLDPRVIPLQRIAGAIFAAFLAAASMVGAVSAWLGSGGSLLAFVFFGGLWIAFNLLMLWHAMRWPAIEYRHTWYRVDERGIEIRRGVYWRVVINVPRSRVQHTDVSQGPLERRFGLGTLVIYTAGTDHAKVALSGLEHAGALAIREHLMPERGSDAV